jgi:glycosyltransferase involved in cell wall biosynthesis
VPKFEIVVVDATTSGKLSHIQEKYPSINWVVFDQKGKRFTISEQRNLGLSLAKGEVIFFIDANCRPQSDWMATMLEDYTKGEDIVCGPCLPSNQVNLVPHAKKHSRPTYVEECATRNVMISGR